jgi:predicted phosphodiesterase
MRLGIVSDIHANLVALQVVQDDLQRRGVEQVVCLGDVVNSGPQPAQTVRRLRSLGWPVVMGNEDQAMLAPRPYQGDDPFYKIISDIDLWCLSQLNPEDLEYVATFQPSLEIPLGKGEKLLAFHGSPHANTDVIKSTTPQGQLDQWFAGQSAQIFAGGHTHTQMLRRFERALLVNPGSVGLAYEHSPGHKEERNVPWAEYALLDWNDQAISIQFLRLPFDVKDLFQAARAVRMPHADWWVGEWQA